MKWTTKQQLAIDQRDKNILVAAAAGSGKTAVLVERIKKLILEDGVSIDRMLIVTFTNAAAAEMKEKIRTALNKEIEKDPENSSKLRQQLTLLARANISTFHAFALDVIRKFYYESDIEPGFSICDDAQRTILKEDSLDLLMEKWFAEDSEEFYEFLNWYSSHKNQKRIREIIDSSYNVLQSLPYPWQWLDEKIEDLKKTPEEFAYSDTMKFIWSFIRDSLDSARDYSYMAAEELASAGLERLMLTVQDRELKSYEQMAMAAEAQNMEELGGAIAAFSPARLTAKKDEKEDYEPVKALVAAYRGKAKKIVDELASMFFTQTMEEQVEELNLTAVKAETLRKLLLDFDGIFRMAKAERQVVDFNDIEHFCLSILESPDAAAHYRNKFRYIFIDEYQDTNILQEEIISKIKRENNLFMVGDIKQSIYKFRLAEPEIFRAKYTVYGGSEPNSTKIDLNQNFRSKAVILDEINRIFEPMMDGYDADARLYPGVEYDGPYSYTPQVKVVDLASAADADEAVAELKNTEIEALEVCRIIQENLGRKFFDHKAGVEREIRLRDIVILMRGVKNYADVFYTILRENGIESFVDDAEGYFDTMEINVFMNLLSVIDNKKQDVPLISVLHSEIFRFSSDELAVIRSGHKEGAYADAFRAYGEDGKNKALRDKCANALRTVREWKEQSASMPLGKFIWSLLMETGYYVEIGAMPGGKQRQANLRALVDKAEKYSQDRQSSLYSFVRYIDAVKTRKVAMGQVKLVGENDDLVRIMTIHKSKGLEFPMVIVSGMGRQLNYTKVGRGVILHKDIGIGMTLADYEGHWHRQTLLQRLIAKQIKKEEVQEEVRVLYVALTRAKDILYLTGTVKDGEKFMDNREMGLSGDISYLDMIQEVSDLEVIGLDRLPQVQTERRMLKGNPLDWDVYEGSVSEEEREDILRRLDFVYPYEESRKLKSKYSVSEINAMDRPQEKFQTVLAVPKFRQTERKLTAAEKGTVYHGIMEHVDFGRGRADGLEYIGEAAAGLVQAELFTAEEIASVKLERIEEFFKSELGQRCASAFDAGKLVRERPFDLQMELEGEQIIVQGIIDCYFEEADGYVLIDYKSNWIDASKPFAQEEQRLRAAYQKQIDIYRRALEVSGGKPVKEAYLYLFDAGKQIRM